MMLDENPEKCGSERERIKETAGETYGEKLTENQPDSEGGKHFEHNTKDNPNMCFIEFGIWYNYFNRQYKDVHVNKQCADMWIRVEEHGHE